MNRGRNPKVGKSKATIIPKGYDWGLYVWKKADGKWFTDGQGNVLNIPAMRGDLEKLGEISRVAAHHGQGDGQAIFFPGIKRVTDEVYSEQKDRMAQGLIPNMDDLGAVHAAQQTLKQYGDEG
jgi:hypothetical protein